MSEWRSLNFTECLEKIPKTTKIPKKKFRSSGKFPIVSQERGLINGYWDEASDVVKVDRPIVIFGDHTQVVKLVDFDFVVGADGVKVLKPKQFLDAKYFYYFLMGHPLKELGYARHYRLLKELEVSFPSLPEQKRIVAILDEAFAGIETAIANTERNLANVRDLFESCMNSVFSQRGEDWIHTTVGRLVEHGIVEKPIDGNHGEIHPRKADFVETGVPFIMAADLDSGRVNQETCNFISRDQADGLRKGFAIDGDVLLSHKGTIGRSAVLKTDLDYVMLTPQVTYYRIKDKEALSNRFLYYYFQSLEFLSELRRIAGSGSTRAYIGITRQLDLPISYPKSLDSQREYADRFDELRMETRRLVTVYEKKLTALAELKQSLLQKAFSGELTGRKTEDWLQEAVA